MNWLPAEPEKVEFFEKLGLPRRLIPRRIYYGVAVGNQKRYFALKLPLAGGSENCHLSPTSIRATRTDTELCSWGAAHGPLWDAASQARADKSG